MTESNTKNCENCKKETPSVLYFPANPPVFVDFEGGKYVSQGYGNTEISDEGFACPDCDTDITDILSNEIKDRIRAAVENDK